MAIKKESGESKAKTTVARKSGQVAKRVASPASKKSASAKSSKSQTAPTLKIPATAAQIRASLGITRDQMEAVRKVLKAAGVIPPRKKVATKAKLATSPAKKASARTPKRPTGSK